LYRCGERFHRWKSVPTPHPPHQIGGVKVWLGPAAAACNLATTSAGADHRPLDHGARFAIRPSAIFSEENRKLGPAAHRAHAGADQLFQNVAATSGCARSFPEFTGQAIRPALRK
jgi:hypothetical protein